VGIAWHHPCPSSYYNALCGGLWGAERLGFEVSYWGDAVREPMLRAAVERAEDGPVAFGPSLAPFQLAGVNLSSPAMLQHGVELRGIAPERPEATGACRVAVIYRRRANLDSLEPLLRESRTIGEFAVQGVWLARLIELPAGGVFRNSQFEGVLGELPQQPPRRMDSND
jgi:hypothetical protein